MRQVWPMVDGRTNQRCPVLGDNQSDTSVPKAMFGTTDGGRGSARRASQARDPELALRGIAKT